MNSSLHCKTYCLRKGPALIYIASSAHLYESCWFSRSFGRRGSLARIYRGLHTFLLFEANFFFDFKLRPIVCPTPIPSCHIWISRPSRWSFPFILGFLIDHKRTFFNKEVSCSATWSLPFILGPLHWPSIRQQRNIVPSATYCHIHHSLIIKNKLKQRNIFNVWFHLLIVYARSMTYEWDVESTKSCTENSRLLMNAPHARIAFLPFFALKMVFFPLLCPLTLFSHLLAFLAHSLRMDSWTTILWSRDCAILKISRAMSQRNQLAQIMFTEI